MNRHLSLLGLIALVLLVGNARPLSAQVLCIGQNESLSVRTQCKTNETQVDPAALGLVGPKGNKGDPGLQGLQGTPGTGPVNQECPPSMFVIGFDGQGALTCGFPGAFEVTMPFVNGTFDLDTDLVLVVPPGEIISFEADLLFQSLGPYLTAPIVGLTQLALLAIPFDSVGPSHVATASFTSGYQVFQGFNDTLLLRTSLGHVFKVGKAVQNAEDTVTFWYARLQ